MTGIDRLRKVVRLFNNTSEDFNQRYNEKQLLAIAEAYFKCKWDITPDQWSKEQVSKAIMFGAVPTFEEE